MSAQPIVAAADGSQESLRAAEWAAREAALRGAPLRIVAAADEPHRGDGTFLRVRLDRLAAAAEDAIAAARAGDSADLRRHLRRFDAPGPRSCPPSATWPRRPAWNS
jgi:nucleotide-binding universal stress UspA family protein